MFWEDLEIAYELLIRNPTKEVTIERDNKRAVVKTNEDKVLIEIESIDTSIVPTLIVPS